MDKLFEYKIEYGKVFITKYVGRSKDVVIPEEIEGYQVTNIDNYALSYNNLTSVDLTSIKSIGYFAFYNNELTSVDLSGIKSIGNRAFNNNKLEAVLLPKKFRERTVEIFNFDEKELDNRNKKFIKKYVDKMRKLYMKKLYKNSRKYGLIFEYIIYYTYRESYDRMLEEAIKILN